MTVKETFDKFIYAKRLQGLSDKTIKDYKQMVGFVVRFLGEDTDIQDINRDKIDAYIEYQLDQAFPAHFMCLSEAEKGGDHGHFSRQQGILFV